MKINKGQFQLSSQMESLRFHLKRGRGHLFRYIINRARWHYYPRMRYVSRFPEHIDIEISSACDMSCPMCYRRMDEFKTRVQATLMDLALFKKLVDECVKYNAYSIRLSLRGEAFLHPNIVEMIQYAKRKGIREVSTLTNGFKLNPELFVEVMDVGLDWLTISFDGLGKTYERIRQPAKFEEAVDKIRRYNEIKKAQGKVKPVIKVQSIWPAIEDDIEAYYGIFAPIVDQIASNPLIEYLHRDADIEYEDDFICPVPWQRLSVSSNGLVLMCVNDEFGENIIGDTKKESLYGIWNGQLLQKIREIHKNRGGIKKLDPCKKCYLPRKINLERGK